MIFDFFRNTAGAVREINQKYEKPHIEMTRMGPILSWCAPVLSVAVWSESWSTSSSLCCTRSRCLMNGTTAVKKLRRRDLLPYRSSREHALTSTTGRSAS